MTGLVAFLSVFAIIFAARIPCKEGPNIKEYIAGGKDTNITEVRYQASLHLNTRFFCGASIISSTHLVTPAHCLTDSSNQRIDYQIKAGTSYEFRTMTWQCLNSRNLHSRVLIKLADNVPAEGEMVKTSGWGCTKENGFRPRNLQSVEVPMINRKTCEKNYENMNITPRMIFAGVEGKDSCLGDSGGPLAYKNTLAGLVSTGEGCGRKGFPGVYTKIAHPDISKFLKEHSNV